MLPASLPHVAVNSKNRPDEPEVCEPYGLTIPPYDGHKISAVCQFIYPALGMVQCVAYLGGPQGSTKYFIVTAVSASVFRVTSTCSTVTDLHDTASTAVQPTRIIISWPLINGHLNSMHQSKASKHVKSHHVGTSFL